MAFSGYYGASLPAKAALKVMVDHAESATRPWEICNFCMDSMRNHDDPAVAAKAAGLFVKNIDAALTKMPEDRVRAMLNTVFFLNGQRKLGMDDVLERLLLSILETAPATLHPWDGHLFARDLAEKSKHHPMSARLLEKSLSVAVSFASKLDEPEHRVIHAGDYLYDLAAPFPAIRQQINDVILTNLPQTDARTIRDYAQLVCDRTEGGSPQHEKAKVLLDRANTTMRLKKFGVPVEGIRKAASRYEQFIESVADRISDMAGTMARKITGFSLSSVFNRHNPAARLADAVSTRPRPTRGMTP